MKKPLLLAALVALAACTGPREEKVADFSNDWTGNEMVVSAIRDPKLPQVLCHFASFDRSFLDRIGKGNWFENPSNSAIACHLTGPIDEAALAKLPKTEEVFARGTSLMIKAIAVRRVVDLPNRSLIYVSYGREVASASAKMDMSVIALPAAAASK
jgi:CreA protein